MLKGLGGLGGLGDMGKMMKAAQEMQGKMAALQEELDTIIVEGESGAGLVKAKANAKGEPYFILKATNGQEIGRSEYYSGNSAMENGIASVKTNAPDAKVDDTTA